MNLIEKALLNLIEGKLVIFPTETVYGLGADAENTEAVRKVYLVKNRPLNHPVIVHIAHKEDLCHWAIDIPDEAFKLVDKFWPGPLTIILRKSPSVSDLISGSQSTVGIRCPSHPIAQNLLKSFSKVKGNRKGALIAPSANKFGKVSPTEVGHIYNEFSSNILKDIVVLDGGSSEIGIESTIIDMSGLSEGKSPVILRPGHVTWQDISSVIKLDLDSQGNSSIIVPGSLKSHYATNTPLVIVDSHLIENRICSLLGNLDKLAVLSFSDRSSILEKNVDWYIMPKDPIEYASKLYATMRSVDIGNYSKIIVERLPVSYEWMAVSDRLYKSAAAFGLT
ncbi:translation factor [Candidatus Kinetoplastibacterium desouzaii TCC079E]|uniref:Threonylcarbamoyl-AMP synthase n=1 Tax=Candidatus Kinetoplastidibacterium desouzai TCC079E TaxID=1208919 RepID=M1LTR0_9PROT|nr:L-threonylcarbamoyladenylate synthase [Candidatus Kinetoplastibacterium desouzaii]AGF46689.1 translation factor [Candidatus Kinetoplastibacterium desouzaii TCC079E]